METTEENQEEVQDFNIRKTTAQEAEAAVETSGVSRNSAYEPVADAWAEAREEEDGAVVLEDVTKNDIQNIRNLIYRRFDKENVIVRSSKEDEDSFNIAIRERKDGEYLREEDEDEGADQGAPDAEVADSAPEVEEDEGADSDEETDFNPSFD